jgi:hypothetical protein
MLRNTKYAYVKKDNSDLVSDIQEKNSFTDNPMQEEASAGLYAFRSGTLLIDSLREQVSKGYSHKGEFYISLTILPLLEKKLKVKKKEKNSTKKSVQRLCVFVWRKHQLLKLMSLIFCKRLCWL